MSPREIWLSFLPFSYWKLFGFKGNNHILCLFSLYVSISVYFTYFLYSFSTGHIYRIGSWRKEQTCIGHLYCGLYCLSVHSNPCRNILVIFFFSVAVYSWAHDNSGKARILVQMWWSPKPFYCTIERVWFQKEVDVSVYLWSTYAFLSKNWIWLRSTICWFDTQIWWNDFNSQGNIFSHGYHLFFKENTWNLLS